MDIYDLAEKVREGSEFEAEKHINNIIDNDGPDFIKNMALTLASAFRCGYQTAIQNMIKEGNNAKRYKG